MIADGVHDEGGSGTPIVLLHGLMGRSRTWRRQVPWLRELGHVHTVDAAGHGRPAPHPLSTEAFVDDLTEQLRGVTEPMVLVGHSMGGLHAWMFAARHPARVRAIVVEDMAPDFRGRSAHDWAETIRSWPAFADDRAVLAHFGDVAGQYFLDALDRTPEGFRLHGDVETFRDISQEWGTRDFWQQWAATTAPALVIEGEYSITPQGQMRRMATARPGVRYERVEGAAHLVHDEQPERYRELVEPFVRAHVDAP
ncbi:alpha/beta hydrolase [Rhodococcus rhodnii]|uniref:Alpha/beta hydrolase n=1 Tax=Rhodococcus rhodnii TaxID=38312 RepID=A0A6P2CEC2_9NOCA|nr:alpha/beta hydrolase [Rhodococcus rhodnii]TXG89258.1 alpha/beta hydrolase [Rhodococcus rhodnii]